MDKILVFSDLHGETKHLERLYECAIQEEVDHILCAGDIVLEHMIDAIHFFKDPPIPLSIVRGNCDRPSVFSERALPIPPLYRVFSYKGSTIFLTHGDLFTDWKQSPITLSNHDMFICGHTHVAQITHHKNTPWVINPGSVSRPRGSYPCSYVLITPQAISLCALHTREILYTLQRG